MQCVCLCVTNSESSNAYLYLYMVYLCSIKSSHTHTQKLWWKVDGTSTNRELEVQVYKNQLYQASAWNEAMHTHTHSVHSSALLVEWIKEQENTSVMKRQRVCVQHCMYKTMYSPGAITSTITIRWWKNLWFPLIYSFFTLRVCMFTCVSVCLSECIHLQSRIYAAADLSCIFTR